MENIKTNFEEYSSPNEEEHSPSQRPMTTTSLISELLQVFQNVTSDPSKKRTLPDVDITGKNVLSGYSGMHDTTVQERSLAFNSKSNRDSLIPTLRVEEKGKRILREEWIKNNSPASSPCKSKSNSPKPITDNTVNIVTEFEDERRLSRDGGNRKSMSLSQAR